MPMCVKTESDRLQQRIAKMEEKMAMLRRENKTAQVGMCVCVCVCVCGVCVGECVW